MAVQPRRTLWRLAEVIEVVAETPRTKSLLLEVPGWEGHKAGRHTGYCHIEKLANLEQLPPTGFMVSCFPVKIERASAGWTRAVAILE